MARGISIHIGLNSVDPEHYNGWDGTLSACELDAGDMTSLARGEGFDTRTLLTGEATADAVTKLLAIAAGELAKGDILFVTYSGHGGQVPDGQGEEEDRMDETWVLHDRQLVDDELYALWSEFSAGVRIFVLSDSCHSGSVTRAMFDAVTPQIVDSGMIDDPAPRTKELPRGVQDATYEHNRALYDKIQEAHRGADETDVAATVILISGCQDNQLSLDGTRNGLFTQNVLAAWEDGRFAGGHRRFWQAIQARMPPTQSPNLYRVGAANRAFMRQRPLTI